ncbi:MAG TPA: EamA family transporter, partial [Rhodospirillales bacterium]|nr:EamA family transporter [Rhodospirillales bacterium]
MLFDSSVPPAALAVTSAFLFALSIQVQNLGLKHAEPRPGVIVNIGTTAIVFWIIAPFYVEASYWLTTATLFFLVVGLFRPALSINLAVAGVKHLGPSLTSGLAATNPLFAAGFAILLLGEQLTWPMALGTLAVVGGVAVSAFRPGGSNRGWPLWAIGLPLGAAFFRALGHPLTMIGLEDIPSPLYAGLISYTVSIIVVYGAFRAQGRRLPTLTRGYLWFVASGLLNGVS